jgi:hypothetical protein
LVLGSKVGVPHGGDDDFVTEKVLNGAKVDAFHHQPALERVPQTVPCEVGHIRLFADLWEQLVRRLALGIRDFTWYFKSEARRQAVRPWSGPVRWRK